MLNSLVICLRLVHSHSRQLGLVVVGLFSLPFLKQADEYFTSLPATLPASPAEHTLATMTAGAAQETEQLFVTKALCPVYENFHNISEKAVTCSLVRTPQAVKEAGSKTREHGAEKDRSRYPDSIKNDVLGTNQTDSGETPPWVSMSPRAILKALTSVHFDIVSELYDMFLIMCELRLTLAVDIILFLMSVKKAAGRWVGGVCYKFWNKDVEIFKKLVNKRLKYLSTILDYLVESKTADTLSQISGASLQLLDKVQSRINACKHDISDFIQETNGRYTLYLNESKKELFGLGNKLNRFPQKPFASVKVGNKKHKQQHSLADAVFMKLAKIDKTIDELEQNIARSEDLLTIMDNVNANTHTVGKIINLLKSREFVIDASPSDDSTALAAPLTPSISGPKAVSTVSGNSAGWINCLFKKSSHRSLSRS